MIAQIIAGVGVAFFSVLAVHYRSSYGDNGRHARVDGRNGHKWDRNEWPVRGNRVWHCKGNGLVNPPKGIDPKVWEMAIALADIWQAPMHHDYQIFAEDVSGAIQKAIEAEREECAQEVERLPQFMPLPDEDVERYGVMVRQTRRADLSQAIRNRSNTTTERNEG